MKVNINNILSIPIISAKDGGQVLNCVPSQEKSDDIGRSIINDRERLKETDEYKKAMKEEWASRGRELQIQGKEANELRRLRKREKAERKRVLDMGSLLRSLGVQVGSSNNGDAIRAACKRALFDFHPDRAAKSNTLRYQVEAEEKFKLIMRMMEKFAVPL